MRITENTRPLLTLKRELKEGNLPKKQTKLVLAWAELRQEELLANSMLAMNSELPYKIDPLK